MDSYVPEAEECVAALMEAVKHVERAASSLRSAPDAELAMKNAIDGLIGELSEQLVAITHRLNAMPTWKPGR